jgi:hypothetical protein
LQNGLHLSKRQAARQVPLIAPNLPIASIAYSEQVGIKRQQGGKSGDITFL